MSYFKVQRESQVFDYLIKKRHSAFVLLFLIARRAKRTLDHPDKSLEIGECYIGDYDTYGATEQIYKTDKALLKSTNQITTRATNRGTIAKLVDISLFDINEEKSTNKSTNELSDYQRATNEQLTTNNNVKNEKNDNTYKKRTYLLNIPSNDIEEFKSTFNLTLEEIKKKGTELYDYCESKDKDYKNHKALLRTALRKLADEKPKKGGTFNAKNFRDPFSD